MTSSDLIHELKASRPAAPTALRARVREIPVQETARAPWPKLRFPIRPAALIAAPAPPALRARGREISVQEPARAPWPKLRFPVRRAALIAVPAAAAVAFASAGVLGLTRSGGTTQAFREEAQANKVTTEDGPAYGA